MVGSVVVLYLHSTSNHNSELASEYLITSCIISSFYIKPQRSGMSPHGWFSCIISSFYIKPQPQYNPFMQWRSCIISSFYIKPQLVKVFLNLLYSCIISSFYIKPQHIPLTLLIFNCLKTILGDMKLFDEAYLIQSY